MNKSSELPLSLSSPQRSWQTLGRRGRCLRIWSSLVFPLLAICVAHDSCHGSDEATAQRFETEILPILSEHCFDCHGYGVSEGGLSLDVASPHEQFLKNRELWWAVLKNLRARVMPPVGMEPPSDEEQRQIADWIKTDVFQIDPHNIDPGPSSVRRLNRFEYGNTLRDLMGIDIDVETLFPPDDSGFGFDNVGDALSLSPMLVEKYLHVARTVVDRAVPKVTRHIPLRRVEGDDFRSADGSSRGNHLPFDVAAHVAHRLTIEAPGTYRVIVDAEVDGSFEFDKRRCRIIYTIDGTEREKHDYEWHEEKKVRYESEETWQAGEHTLSIGLQPLPAKQEEDDPELEYESDDQTHVNFRLQAVRIEGPLDPENWQHPPNYERFFPRDEPPTSADERLEYASEVLRQFAQQAFRRPPDDATVRRLATLAESVYSLPGKTFEAGVAEAMVAALASPRFLLRIDFPAATAGAGTHPYTDEYSLASRLSYFFWSTMPDEELMRLADRGELRENLDAQVTRLLGSSRSEKMIREFVGQWLRARDVEHVAIDPLAVMGRTEEWDELRREFRRRRDRSETNEEERQNLRERFGELRSLRESLDGDVRRAMRRETEMLFAHIVREDRSVLELIDSDYTFLNEDLAEYYGMEGVEGDRMRLVSLPEGSPRGGVLTQGTMLTVTSNPTRTSPVKRGLFILENLLGTPPPPPPPNIPELEDSVAKFKDREPTLREVLEAHRESALCASCHARMDPLGISLENFNALGWWRDEENGQPIDASGELISGETFQDVRDLKLILASDHKLSFYRCLTEKLLTYALGRGLEYYDVHTVDRIVDELDRQHGKMSVVFQGVVRSPPFQRQRNPQADSVSAIGNRNVEAHP